MNEWKRPLSKTKIALGAVVALGLLFGLVVVPYVFRWYAAPWTGALEEREITTRGAFRIQGYEQFYRWQEESVAILSKLDQYVDRELDVREHTECRGLRAQYADVVSQYNAASRAERTDGQWRADDLPELLSNDGLPVCHRIGFD